jgi:hypothetical protein
MFKDFLEFMGEHPVLTVILVLCLIVLVDVVR